MSNFPTVRITADHFSKFEKDMIEATNEGLRETAKAVAKHARKNVRRAAVHRVERTYPGGRKFQDPKPLHKSVRYRVKKERLGRRGMSFARIFFTPGYSNFPSTEAWDTLKEALGAEANQAVPNIEKKAPK